MSTPEFEFPLVTVCREQGSIYIRLAAGKIVRTQPNSIGVVIQINFDYDENDKVLGIEIILG